MSEEDEMMDEVESEGDLAAAGLDPKLAVRLRHTRNLPLRQ